MPITPTYPGVYVEEIPSGVHTITGVATSIAVFVDFFPRGPMNTAVQILSLSDFQRVFGGLDTRSEASYSIQQFFLNGGSQAWVIRSASPLSGVAPTPASVRLDDKTSGGSAMLTLTAANEGAWGNALRAQVSPPLDSAGSFNLTLTEYATVNNRNVAVKQEVFRNLSMDTTKPTFVQAVVNDPNIGSALARVSAPGASPPAASGTVTGSIPAAGKAITTPTKDVANADGSHTLTLSVNVTIAPAGASSPPSFPATFSLTLPASNTPVTLSAIATLLQGAIRSANPTSAAFTTATVEVITSGTNQQLHVLAGPDVSNNVASFAKNGADTTADDLEMTAQASGNVQEYIFGDGSISGGSALLTSLTGIANTAQGASVTGTDGEPPIGADLVAALAALDQIDLFNLLCIPRTALVGGAVSAVMNALSDADAQMVITVAETACQNRRAFFLMDTPAGIATYTGVKGWLAAHDTLRGRNAALYYPRVQVPDPLNGSRLRSIGASGTIAGLCARIDAARGVWKAPAGTEATLVNVSQLDDVLTDAENGVLNPLAINCLRNFPVYGNIAWGARTLDGSDQQASDWKYVPVRRLALFLEESLFRGTKWVVFEPNDEPLWAQIRLNIGAFLHDLFRQGAFQGQTPRAAYFVKCDSETTTQTDINNGIVNIVVGFAPLKPAEFVILQIQQMAGQIQA